jgi:hypothetical protein
MVLTLGPLLLDAGIDLSEALVIRHAFAQEPEESGLTGLHAASTHTEILEYTRRQSANTRRFPAHPPRFWIILIKDGVARQG